MVVYVCVVHVRVVYVCVVHVRVVYVCVVHVRVVYVCVVHVRVVYVCVVHGPMVSVDDFFLSHPFSLSSVLLSHCWVELCVEVVIYLSSTPSLYLPCIVRRVAVTYPPRPP